MSPQQPGLGVAERAIKILKKEKVYQEPEGDEKPYDRDGKVWKIYGAPQHRKSYSKAFAQKLRDCHVEAYSYANNDEYLKCYGKNLPEAITGYGRGVRVMYSSGKKTWAQLERCWICDQGKGGLCDTESL